MNDDDETPTPTSTSTIRVYQYGLLAPSEGRELVREQIRAGHAYQNQLVAIERERRRAVREARSRLCPEVAELESALQALVQQLESARTTIRKERGQARARVPAEAATHDARALRAALKTTRAALKEARTRAKEDPELQQAMRTIDEEAKLCLHVSRACCGAYWGTYLLAEAAADQARKQPMDPRFHRFNGSGSIGVQLQGGADVAQIVGSTDPRLRIEPVPDAAWHAESRSERRRLSRTRLWMRVGSDGAQPRWAVFPMVMHRPLPQGCRLKGATVHVRRIGTQERWTVSLTLELEGSLRSVPPSEHTVAVDLGWRQRHAPAPQEGGVGGGVDLRVGTWVGSDGETGEIRLPARILARLSHAESLRSIQDRNMDALRLLLLQWIEAREQAEAALPPCLCEARKTLAQWKSQARMTRLVRRWHDERVPGDEEIYTLSEAWRRQARHLYQWESCERSRALGHRRELYRNAAAALAARYPRIVLEDLDLSALKRRAQPEQDAPVQQAPQRSQQVSAAPGELRNALVNAFGRSHVITVEAAGTTRTCHVCGQDTEWDHAPLHHTCERCGAHWDQDENAARNMLQRATERARDAPAPAPARKRFSRRAAKTEA